MKTLIRTGCDCVLWTGKRVKRGDSVPFPEEIADLLASREPDDWKPAVKATKE